MMRNTFTQLIIIIIIIIIIVIKIIEKVIINFKKDKMHFINNKNDKLNPNIPFREIKSFLKNLKNIKEY